ncbi:TetR/AcrR family transcriptional regulator [Altericroceibacterium spongiae]|uniref:TetR/AcrR family transcriptional regulator n=1 Tax=Altericroceibacterium spongiae TaxID=2320269 RepID=A0A420E8Q5_9SPHN|nr:TetR/AcrR family transcriptional regulator [Altericroceibacterium spongiae]RKF15472.1 TetR/AcrR family transcriptional regulator [Altericroceibacterium spongiae]
MMAITKEDLERRAQIGRERRARTRARILLAAFNTLGTENGLLSRIEDIAAAADVTRATFYNHFAGMEELLQALSHEVTHDFLVAVRRTVDSKPDPRERATVGIRYYLHRARNDEQWAWSMINMSGNGIIFGAETFQQAEQTIQEGMDSGMLNLPSSQVGRDLLMGTSLAAVETMVREETPEDYPEAIAGFILLGMGVNYEEARQIAHLPLPALIDE